jgi:hypothetical protein
MIKLLLFYVSGNLELKNQRGTMTTDLHYCLSQFFLFLYPFLLLEIVNILTFIIVELHTGTNFPAVSLNSWLAVAMMKLKER